MKEKFLILRLKHFARSLKEHTEYSDSYSMGQLEMLAARNKEETIQSVGDSLLEILEVDEETFQFWLKMEEDK